MHFKQNLQAGIMEENVGETAVYCHAFRLKITQFYVDITYFNMIRWLQGFQESTSGILRFNNWVFYTKLIQNLSEQEENSFKTSKGHRINAYVL